MDLYDVNGQSAPGHRITRGIFSVPGGVLNLGRGTVHPRYDWFYPVADREEALMPYALFDHDERIGEAMPTELEAWKQALEAGGR